MELTGLLGQGKKRWDNLKLNICFIFNKLPKNVHHPTLKIINALEQDIK